MYLRISTADKAERYSLPAQERHGVEFFEAHDTPWTWDVDIAAATFSAWKGA
jgi:hypothetical protein